MKRTKRVVIDPARMNIINRLAAGSRSNGPLELNGGLLLQGEHQGSLTVREGPLVIFAGASVANGVVDVDGDVYVFGCIGTANDAAAPTLLRCSGMLYLTSKAVAYGTMQCAKAAIYQGAQVRGVVETTPPVEAPLEASEAPV